MTTSRPSGSFSHSSSVKVSTPKLPTISTVITVPPWAKDEPPSPQEAPSSTPQLQPHPAAAADVASSSNSDFSSTDRNSNSLSRWFAFTLPRQTARAPQSPDEESPRGLTRRPSFFADKRRSWVIGTPTIPTAAFPRRAHEKSPADPGSEKRKNWNISIAMPTPPRAPFTRNQADSPGWETPWTARVGAQGPYHSRSRRGGVSYDEDVEENLEGNSGSTESHDDHSKWKTRRKRLRLFLLNHPYVPLLFRLINLSFTTGTLAVAIHIRLVEHKSGLVGVVGSSPTLVIIFAPLTLVHVIGAIYLEYFGRPLGLWRTSAKLAHTLSEVLFICAWSAALSLTFDNFFTSLIPCASPSAISWYDPFHRPSIGVPSVEGSVGDVLCDSQLALICMVFASLVMYCTNLVISLYRIIEKVKYLPGAPLGLRS
ncbi:hypothetical protein BDP27DRAFT_1392918 [Rhodocollybia butyracea]|uniref:Uncharacterized protein n=1 Tax=Rhodocollybia butyracea TaxID=206335 RepID=A0A9P5PRJ1_9AGAR|nr:hypothetical protein BDP27DRAFT_1392918 [Rhodocollybia butyracea]